MAQRFQFKKRVMSSSFLFLIYIPPYSKRVMSSSFLFLIYIPPLFTNVL